MMASWRTLHCHRPLLPEKTLHRKWSLLTLQEIADLGKASLRKRLYRGTLDAHFPVRSHVGVNRRHRMLPMSRRSLVCSISSLERGQLCFSDCPSISGFPRDRYRYRRTLRRRCASRRWIPSRTKVSFPVIRPNMIVDVARTPGILRRAACREQIRCVRARAWQ